MVIHVGDDDYEVGFRKPPRHSRFKPGQSGNPTGRKRSVQTPDWEDPLKAILQLKIPILWDGKRIRVPAFKALMMNTLKKALSGCTKSTKLLLDSTDGFINSEIGCPGTRAKFFWEFRAARTKRNNC